jgi:hypothetical protein
VTDEPERKLVYVGSFESGLHHLIVPAAVIAPIAATFDAERRARELAAEKARLAPVQAAKSRAKLRRALAAVCFQRGRRER